MENKTQKLTFEENVKTLAEQFNNSVELGQGMFLNFDQTPEFKQPVTDYLITHYGWTFEKPFFGRKPIQ